MTLDGIITEVPVLNRETSEGGSEEDPWYTVNFRINWGLQNEPTGKKKISESLQSLSEIIEFRLSLVGS